jgi:hypothetical protein
MAMTNLISESFRLAAADKTRDSGKSKPHARRRTECSFQRVAEYNQVEIEDNLP